MSEKWVWGQWWVGRTLTEVRLGLGGGGAGHWKSMASRAQRRKCACRTALPLAQHTHTKPHHHPSHQPPCRQPPPPPHHHNKNRPADFVILVKDVPVCTTTSELVSKHAHADAFMSVCGRRKEPAGC